MTRRGWLLFLVMGFIWGTPYLLIRVAVRDISPPTLLFLRTAPAALVLLPYLVRRDRWAALRPHLFALLAYTVVEMAVPWLLVARAEQRVSSSLAGLLVATVPMFSVVLGLTSRHEERHSARRLVGLGIGFAGVALIVGLDVHGADLIAVGELLVVAFGYAFGPLLFARYLVDVSALTVVDASLLVVAVIYLPFAATHWPRHVGHEELAAVATLTILCTMIAFLIFFKLIEEVGPSRAVVITYVNPAVALALGVAFLGEHLSVAVVVGFPLIIVGSVLGTAPNRGGRGGRGALRARRDDPSAVEPR